MRRVLRLAVSCMLVATLVSFQSIAPASAQATAIAAGTAVNGVVDNLRDSIRQLLDKLDNSVSSGTFLTRMQLTNLLAELDYHATGLLDKTFGQLDAEQQTFFNNTQQTVAELGQMGDHLTDDADSVVQRVEFAIGSVPFTDHEPRLRTVSPRVVTASQAGQPITIAFDGSWLANASPTLTIEGSACKLSSLKETEADFQCDPAQVTKAVANGAARLDGTFAVPLPVSFWDWVMSVFGRPTSTKNYPVSVGVVPDVFAHAKVTVTALVATDHAMDRKADYDTGAEHCVWGRDVTVNVSPQDPSWSIDVNSIKLVLVSGEHSELRNVTAKGFQVYAVGHNSGSCAREPLTGIKIANDGRGWANGYVTWTEHQSVDVPQDSMVFDGDIKWGDARVVTLPARLQSFVANLAMFNGNARDYNAPATDDFVSINRDETNSSLKLTPRAVDAAFK